MKRTIKAIGLAALTLAVASCEDLENLCGIGEDEMAVGQVFVESYNHVAYVSRVMDEAMRDSAVNLHGNGKIDGAQVTLINQVLTVDYGVSGVICPSDNKLRKGKLIADLTSNYLVQGGSMEANTEAYHVDNVLVSGSVTMTNDGAINGANPQISIDIPNFKVGDQTEFNGMLNMLWQNGFETDDLNDDEFLMGGGISGEELMSKKQLAGTMLQDLSYKKSCTHLLEAGVISLNVTDSLASDLSMEIDFLENDGCNNLFNVSADCSGSPISLTYPFN